MFAVGSQTSSCPLEGTYRQFADADMFLQEIRPAAEMGPIILCLDTSGSMRGAREVVAKALALECLRGAHRQQRPCYLYAFSGPGNNHLLAQPGSGLVRTAVKMLLLAPQQQWLQGSAVC